MQRTQRAEWMERQNSGKSLIFSEKEPRFNSEESRKSRLWPTDDI
jgi:hypothetical protein